MKDKGERSKPNKKPVEFKINEYITLKLENRETVIYVNGERFIQCKYLLLNIPIGETEGAEKVEDIKSIDEAAETLDGREEQVKVIPSETEFWGHCSNLQAWAENNYDTRLLHRNLAFPLLKKLTKAKDPQAKKVFKEEIAIRLGEGNRNVMLFLINGGYLSYFNEEEMEVIVWELFETKNKKLIFFIIKQRFLQYLNEDERKQAWQKLLEQNPTNNDLFYIIRNFEFLRKQVGQKLLEQNPTNNDLFYIIEYVESLRKQAGQKLLEQNPTNNDLSYVIRNVESLRKQAGQKLLEQNPTNNDLRYIISYVQPLKKQARKLLKNRRRKKLTRYIKKYI